MNTKTKPPFSNRVHHIGIVVRDIDKAIERLATLGIGPFEELNNQYHAPLVGEPMFRGRPMRVQTKIWNAKVGDIALELFEPDEGESPYKEFLDSKGEGIHHIGFLVDDLEQTVARLSKKGASVVLSVRWQGNGGCDYLDLGVGGITVELLRY